MKNRSENRGVSVRVVALGGGTGLSTVLRGLKQYVRAEAARAGAADRGSGRRGDGYG